MAKVNINVEMLTNTKLNHTNENTYCFTLDILCYNSYYTFIFVLQSIGDAKISVEMRICNSEIDKAGNVLDLGMVIRKIMTTTSHRINSVMKKN